MVKFYYNTKSDDPTYYVQRSYRTKDGKSTTQNVERIGKHSELLQQVPDPLTYCQERVAQLTRE